MRFVETGPDIPDELLVARDEGNVLFFCGAGVSLAKAGLADFLNLAGDVIDDLGSLSGSQARRLHTAASTKLPSGAKSYVPVDRMFSSLDLEFDPQEVRDAVARALKPKPDVNLEAHRTLIDLSRGSDGRPRLITTNFDRLFEACDAQLSSWGPPNLPIPERPANFEGIIHLHGRTNEDYTGISNDAVVLSSSDFGKAYLSDGWATHYIRRLMNHFKVVFVGYSADDPPVQYLLEALREEQSAVANIYAFQFGEEVDAQEQWLQKGVVPIAFGDNYNNLWDTLGAWAERARDVDAWYQKTMVEAAAGPSNASPIFRGRIAHLASTPAGMLRLSSSKPLLPSTWLYAFDPVVRYLKPRRLDRYDPNSEEFDPFEHLGLDRDAPPPQLDPDEHYEDRKIPEGAWSAFEPNRRDLVGITEREIGNFSAQSAMAPRLWQLAILVVRSMDDLPALWWAVGQNSVHPSFAHQLEFNLRYRPKGDDGKLTKYWRYLLKAWKEPVRETEQIAIEIVRRAAEQGWSQALVREAINLSQPRMTIKRNFGVAPPMTTDADPANFISLDVEYPRVHQKFNFDPPSLVLVVSLWRCLLVEAEEMENEIGGYLILDTTRADDGQQLDPHSYGLTGPLIIFTQFLEQLAVTNYAATAAEIATWAGQPGLVFERLRIWAAGRPGLMSIAQAETVFASLSDETFWSSKHERDLLFAIRDRWNEMSDAAKRSIEARLLTSPVPYLKDHDADEAAEATAVHRLNAIHWLVLHGVAFGFDVDAEKARFLELAPIWREEFADHTAQPRVSGVYSIDTDTDATGILDVSPDELLPIEVPERGFRNRVEHDPFAGYSKAKPDLAVQALRSAMRRNVDTAWFSWSTFFRSTLEIETSDELEAEVIALIASMPSDEVAKLWYPLVEWFSRRAEKFERRGHGEFDLIWNMVVAAAELHPSGYKQKASRDWSFEALNSIIGRLVLALLDMKTPPGQEGVPPSWILRLNKVLALPGDHARHALHLVARGSRWFHYHETAWWDAQMLTKAHGTGPDSDAFWSGFAQMAHAPEPALARKLKSAMLERVSKGGREKRNLVAYLLSGWGAPPPDQTISDAELRDTLILGDNEVRRSVLWFFGKWASDNGKWRNRVVPFLSKVWPRQRTLKTPQMSSALFRFASAFPEQFTAIIDIVAGRLVPLSRGHDMHLQCEVADLNADGVEALMIALEKLLPEDRSEWPYEGKKIIDSISAVGIGMEPRLVELKSRAAEREY